MSYTIENPIKANAEKVGKLPMWAQDHIRHLERHALRCEQELKRFLDTTTQSNLYVSSHTLNIGDKHYIQADAVSFNLGPRKTIEVRLCEDYLHVMMTQSIVGNLSIRPRVSNVIDIYAE